MSQPERGIDNGHRDSAEYSWRFVTGFQMRTNYCGLSYSQDLVGAKGSELGMKMEVLQRGRDSFFCAFIWLHQMLFMMLGQTKNETMWTCADPATWTCPYGLAMGTLPFADPACVDPAYRDLPWGPYLCGPCPCGPHFMDLLSCTCPCGPTTGTLSM